MATKGSVWFDYFVIESSKIINRYVIADGFV